MSSTNAKRVIENQKLIPLFYKPPPQQQLPSQVVASYFGDSGKVSSGPSGLPSPPVWREAEDVGVVVSQRQENRQITKESGRSLIHNIYSDITDEEQLSFTALKKWNQLDTATYPSQSESKKLTIKQSPSQQQQQRPDNFKPSKEIGQSNSSGGGGTGSGDRVNIQRSQKNKQIFQQSSQQQQQHQYQKEYQQQQQHDLQQQNIRLTYEQQYRLHQSELQQQFQQQSKQNQQPHQQYQQRTQHRQLQQKLQQEQLGQQRPEKLASSSSEFQSYSLWPLEEQVSPAPQLINQSVRNQSGSMGVTMKNSSIRVPFPQTSISSSQQQPTHSRLQQGIKPQKQEQHKTLFSSGISMSLYEVNQEEEEEEGFLNQQQQQQLSRRKSSSEINDDDVEDDGGGSRLLLSLSSFSRPSQKILPFHSNVNPEETIILLNSSDEEDQMHHSELIELQDQQLKQQQQWQSSSSFQQFQSNQWASGGEQRQSLFRYDPSMFQSAAGQFQPSMEAQAKDVQHFDQSKAVRMLDEIPESYFSSLLPKSRLREIIECYFSLERRYVQRINREISGLQCAENLGDYFIRKYAGQLDKKIAGCASAQRFPVRIGVRGDGNCFYRAIITSYLIRVFMGNTFTEVEQIVVQLVDEERGGGEGGVAGVGGGDGSSLGSSFLLNMVQKGVARNDSDVVREILVRELIVMLLTRIQLKKRREDFEGQEIFGTSVKPSENLQLFVMTMLERIAEDHDLDYSLVVLCRSITSHAVKKHAKDPQYAEFLLPEDVEKTMESLKEYKEDAEFHAVYLSAKALDVPIQILQLKQDKYRWFELDESLCYQPAVAKEGEKLDEQQKLQEQRKVVLLLSDGHYDLVMDSSTCRLFFPQLALFNGHKAYRSALELCLEQANTPQKVIERVYELIAEYERFLVDQNESMQRAVSSMVRMQTIIFAGRSTIQEEGQPPPPSSAAASGLLDYEKKEDNEDKGPPSLQPMEEPQLFLLQTSKVESKQGEIGFESEQLFVSQREAAQLVDGEKLCLPSLAVTEQQQHPSRVGVFPRSFYTVADFSRARRSKNGVLTPGGDERSVSTSDGVSFIKSLKNMKNGNGGGSGGMLESHCVCDHATKEKITVKQLSCCKLWMEVCYACYKTRQILLCPLCRKDLLSVGRINLTAKNCKFVCKPCEESQAAAVMVVTAETQGTAKETSPSFSTGCSRITVLFNRLICEDCGIPR